MSTESPSSLSDVPGIVYADLLGTRARTGSNRGVDAFDNHVVQSMHVIALLNATNLLMACPRFRDVQAAVVSDSIFAYCPNPLLATEFACGLLYVTLEHGGVLRGGVEVGTMWLPKADYPEPNDDRLVVFSAMGWGVTGAVEAEAQLKGAAGVRLALGRHLVRWLDMVDVSGDDLARRLAQSIRALVAPRRWLWDKTPQALWMDRNLQKALAAESCLSRAWCEPEALLQNMETTSIDEPGDRLGKRAWDGTIGQLRQYVTRYRAPV